MRVWIWWIEEVGTVWPVGHWMGETKKKREMRREKKS
jgi:hypothetical protein